MTHESLSEREYSGVELPSPPQRSLPQTNFNMTCEQLCTCLTVQQSLNLYLLLKLLKSIKIVYSVCVSGEFPDIISHPFIVNNPRSMHHISLHLLPLLRQHDGKSHCTHNTVRLHSHYIIFMFICLCIIDINEPKLPQEWKRHNEIRVCHAEVWIFIRIIATLKNYIPV